MKTRGDTFYIYGRKPVEEQLIRNPENVMRIFIYDKIAKKGGSLEELRSFARENKIPINPVTREKIKDYIGDVNSQGILALVRKYEFMKFNEWQETISIENLPCVIILDGIQDTHNYGAILRTAAAAGVSAVIVAKDRQAPVNGTVFKTSAGAVLTVPIVQVSNINQTIKKLQDMRFWVAAIDMDDESCKGQSLFNQTFNTPMAFIVGAEGKGISEKTREHADFILSIPMARDIESLNVSVAAAVTLYEWKRQMMKIQK